MDMLDDFINLLDSILDSKRKRHITGGILLSAALLFGGLAVTVVTIKNEEDYYGRSDYWVGRNMALP